jgi:hypothetical protein
MKLHYIGVSSIQRFPRDILLLTASLYAGYQERKQAIA